MQHLIRIKGMRPMLCLWPSDIQTFGAMNAACESGLQISEDFAIAGFDDVELSEMVSTAIRQPMFQMGPEAIKRFMALIADPGLRREQQRIETGLIIRERCGVKNWAGVPEKKSY